jgi:hypothetical protein
MTFQKSKNLPTMQKKFRCSNFGRLMTGATMPGAAGLTEAQSRTLSELLAKEKPTEKQMQTIKELIEKQERIVQPELSKGAKSYIEEEFIKDRFDYRKTFSNIYTEKGHALEQRSIREVGKFLGYPFASKAPEKKLENDFLKTRGYDWKTKHFVFDQKNVWDPTGLKLFEDDKDLAIYECQIRGYAMLINELEGGEIEAGAVIRVLMNPTEEQVLKQAKIMYVDQGHDWSEAVPLDFVQEVQDMFDFEAKFPNIQDRIRIHKVDCTPEHFELIRIYVGLAQEYYNSLQNRIENVNADTIELFRNKK